MHFLHPLYLIGLLAIAIPVIIHLFNFRRFQKVFFTNVKFLEELKIQTRKQSRLRNLLILLMRILAISMLVFAFAQPYIPYSDSQQRQASSNTVSVFVDNSFSMESSGSGGSLLDEAKAKARETVSAYKASDMFQLLTCDFEGRQQRLVSRDDFLKALEEVRISPDVRSLSEIVNRQRDMLRSAKAARKTAFIISDFQKSAYSNFEFNADTSVTTYLLPLKAAVAGNVYIDTCWFSQPAQQPGKVSVLNARVWNKSETDLEKVPLKLSVGGQQKSVAALDIKAGESIVAELPFTLHTPGPQEGLLQVTDYPVVHDDKFYFSFDIVPAISIIAINGNGENRYLNALFSADSTVVFTNAGEKMLDYQKLQSYDLIILNELTSFSSGLSQELKKFAGNGGTILIIPASNPDLTSYSSLTGLLQVPAYRPADTASTRVVSLNTTNLLFRDVFETPPASQQQGSAMELPMVKKHFPLPAGAGTLTVPLMRLLNGDHFFTLTSSGNGQVLQLAVPLDAAFSDFPKTALFVPVLYNTAMISHTSHSLYSLIGDNKAVRVRMDMPTGDNTYKLRAASGDVEIIPQLVKSGNTAGVFVGNLLRVAGNYRLMAGDQLLSTLSYNYNRSESDLQCLSEDEIDGLLAKSHLANIKILKTAGKPVNEAIARINSGVPLWKYCLWLALAFLLAEILLIRLRK